ncbi:uncharacterized protein YMR317W-like isoform X1 [Sitophilus oryzae]|uniref:Uncharacterized protein YMR317W-like isoform X1 n=1 Tax=Sitophilus oryzae TaxID=7048 RepID=A0A6J2XSF8_SITOR|nr:uncharacterized protein YMR317W-like isoform X1 [Sitophilus oryzae]
MADDRDVNGHDDSTLEDPPTDSCWNLFGCCMRSKYASVCVENGYGRTLEKFEFNTNKFRKIRFIMPVQTLMEGDYKRLVFNPDYENLWNPSYKEIIQPRISEQPDTPSASDSGYKGTYRCQPSTSGTQQYSSHASSSGTQQYSSQASSSGTQLYSSYASSSGTQQYSTHALSSGTQQYPAHASSSGTQQYSTHAPSSGTQQYSTHASSSGTQLYSTHALSSGTQQDSTHAPSSGTQLSVPSKQQLSTDASSSTTQTSPQGSTLATQTRHDYDPPLLWPDESSLASRLRTTKSDKL